MINFKYWTVVYVDVNGNDQTATIYFEDEKTQQELEDACYEQFINVASITSITKES